MDDDETDKLLGGSEFPFMKAKQCYLGFAVTGSHISINIVSVESKSYPKMNESLQGIDTTTTRSIQNTLEIKIVVRMSGCESIIISELTRVMRA